MEPPPVMPKLKSQKKRVCLPCRLAHSACDGQDPCRRCVAADSVHQCLPAPSRKRGRPTSALSLAGFADGSQRATSGAAWDGLYQSLTDATAVPTSWQSGVNGGHSAIVDLTTHSPPFLADQLHPPPQHRYTAEHQHQHSSIRSEGNVRHSIVGDADGGDASKRLRMTHDRDSGNAKRGQQLELDGGYVSPLLSLLIEQVRDVKRENASLRRDLNETVKQRVQALEDQNRRLVDEVDQLRALVVKYQHQCQHHLHPGDAQKRRRDSQDSSFFEPSVPTVLTTAMTTTADAPVAPMTRGSKVIDSDRPTWVEVLGMAKHRYIAMHALPFLNKYLSEATSALSVVRDLANDVYAVFNLGAPADPQDLCLHSPIFTYASHNFCALMGFSMHELVGKPIQTISRTDKETLFVILTNIFAKPDSPVGELWTTVQTWQHKTGKPLTLQLNHQVFYNKLCKPQWLVITAEAVVNGLRVTPDIDVLHTPSEFDRFRARFPAFFNSLFTTTTTTRTTTTMRTARLHHHAPNLIGIGGEASSTISTAQLTATATATTQPLLPTSWDLEQWLTAPGGGVAGFEEASIQELSNDDDDNGETPDVEASSSNQHHHEQQYQDTEEALAALSPAQPSDGAQLDDIDDEYGENILRLLNSPLRSFSPFLS